MTAPDSGISEWLTGLVGKCSVCDHLIGFIANDFFMPVTMSMVMLFLWFGIRNPVQRKRIHYGVMCAAGSLGFANLAVHISNRVVEFDPWARPFEVHESAHRAAETLFYFPHDPSFPSNAAACTFGAAFGLLFYHRKASIPLFAIAVLFCFSRVYAGIHYPLDILGGAAIGFGIALFTYGLMRFLWWLPDFFYAAARKVYLA
ncbi:MAG: phosphatase PAP2 family protein [Chloroflexi bacterium]|nr:phosphatase PAP2 family protein [Chloroflexota bacterium]